MDKKYTSLTLVLVGIVAVLLLMGSCDKNPTGPDEDDSTPSINKVTSVVIESPKTLLAVGDSLQLKAIAKDANNNIIEDKIFEWKSSDEELVTVTNEGLVFSHKNGKVIVTATTEDITGSSNLELTISEGFVMVQLGDDVTSEAKEHIKLFISMIDVKNVEKDYGQIQLIEDNPYNLIAATNSDGLPLLEVLVLVGNTEMKLDAQSTAHSLLYSFYGPEIEANTIIQSAEYAKLIELIQRSSTLGVSYYDDPKLLESIWSVGNLITGTGSKFSKIQSEALNKTMSATMPTFPFSKLSVSSPRSDIIHLGNASELSFQTYDLTNDKPLIIEPISELDLSSTEKRELIKVDLRGEA